MGPASCDSNTDDCPSQGTPTELCKFPPVTSVKLPVHSVFPSSCDRTDSPESEMVDKSCLY